MKAPLGKTKSIYSNWQPRVSESLNCTERIPHCPILFSLALVTLKSFPPSSLAVLNWVKWFWHLACHSEGAICVLLPGFFMIFQFLRAFHSSNQERKLRVIHKLRGIHKLKCQWSCFLHYWICLFHLGFRTKFILKLVFFFQDFLWYLSFYKYSIPQTKSAS